MLMSSEFRGGVSRDWYLFWIFFKQGITDKFHHYRIYVTDFREGEFFCPPILEQPQKYPSWIGLKGELRQIIFFFCFLFVLRLIFIVINIVNFILIAIIITLIIICGRSISTICKLLLSLLYLLQHSLLLYSSCFNASWCIRTVSVNMARNNLIKCDWASNGNCFAIHYGWFYYLFI